MDKYDYDEFTNMAVSVKCGYNKLMVKNCPWADIAPNGISCRFDKLTGCENFAVKDGALRRAIDANWTKWNTVDNWHTCKKHDVELYPLTEAEKAGE